MRITGGMLAGRTVARPPGVIRPAMDRMRESVFATLGDLSGKSFLDLFSGSGVIALEAASRGSERVELCEKDKQKIPVLLANVSISERELGVKIECHFMPVEYFIKRCKRSFDCIFFDPPFEYRFHEEALRSAVERGMLSKGGSLLLHRPENRAMPDKLGEARLYDRRSYGRSVVDFYTI